MSAAGALATALAVAKATGDSYRTAVEVAHLADLFGGGGLGGVSAILGGGLELREIPGIPPRGRVRHHPARGTVFVIVAGEAMPSPALLGNRRFLTRVERAADRGLDRLKRHASLESFLREAEWFTDALRLGPPYILRRVHELRSTGTRVGQAMFGRSIFAVPRTRRARESLVAQLTRLKLRAAEVPIASRGARVLPGPPHRLVSLGSGREA
jgi:pantoate kinase